MIENKISQLIAVSDTMRPWTAGSSIARVYQDRVPFADASSFLTDHDVQSEPLSWARPAQIWDNPENVFTLHGQSYTLVQDDTRQVLYSRDDTVHGIPSEGYTVAQPSSLMERASNIMGASEEDLRILAVTALDANRSEWAITVGTQDAITVDGVGSFVSCLVLGTSSNGSIANWFAGCSLQVVCYNTQAHALGEASGNGTLQKVKHTKNANERLDAAEREVRDALGVIVAQTLDTVNVMSELCITPVSDEQWSAFITELFPITADSTKNATTRMENARASVTGLYRSERLGERGNAWNALQSVNTFDLWERGTRGGTDNFARATRELLTGTSGKRESERFDTLKRVLATV